MLTSQNVISELMEIIRAASNVSRKIKTNEKNLFCNLQCDNMNQCMMLFDYPKNWAILRNYRQFPGKMITIRDFNSRFWLNLKSRLHFGERT